MELFEIFNIVGLLLIAATNGWIAVQVRNQKTYNNIEVLPAELDYTPPAIVVNTELDYDKLAAALSKQPAPTIIVQPASPTVIPSTVPSYPYPSGPYWQYPNVSDTAGQINTSDQEYYTINDGTEVPIRSFPRRVKESNGRGDQL